MKIADVREVFYAYGPAKATIAQLNAEIENLERIKAELENEAYGGILSRGGEGSSGKDFGVSDPTPAQAERFSEGVDRTAVAEIANEIFTLRNKMARCQRTIRRCNEWVATFHAETATMLRSRLIERKSLQETVSDVYDKHRIEYDEITIHQRILRALRKIAEEETQKEEETK